MTEEEIGHTVIGAAIKVHSVLGSGSALRLGGFKLGYLLNFNVPLLRDGITRLVNGL